MAKKKVTEKIAEKELNPLVEMFTCPDAMLLETVSKFGFELVMFNYYRFIMPVFACRAEGVVPVEQLEEQKLVGIYNKYIKDSKELQAKNPKETIYGIQLTFSIDTSDG